MKNQKNGKVVLLFLNLNRIGQLALKNKTNMNIISEHMNNVMSNIWNNFTTKELCEEIDSSENITFFRQFIQEANN